MSHRSNDRSYRESGHRRRASRSRSPPPSFSRLDDQQQADGPTNLVNFSFLNHRSELNRVLRGYSARDQLVDNVNDFWLFVNKYEALLKRTRQPILPDSARIKQPCAAGQIPAEYSKALGCSVRLRVPVEELQGRLGPSTVTRTKLLQWLQIIEHYLDFRQREKFTKLRKLRQAQANLPVAKHREEIVEAIRNERVVVLAGDTGCGKSTQVPQYLYRAGYARIACTQPRRIACISLSKRVAHELLAEYRTEVGYQIRFERSKNMHTKIVFITEGLLLRQLASEDSLEQYSVIILDEVHERHLHGDFLLGIAKCLIRARPELKLVLMSATINIKLFADYFSAEEARVIEVPGRLFPIKLHYMPQLQDAPVAGGSAGGRNQRSKTDRLNPEPYVQILQLIDQKYPPSEKGDLLIFLSGLNEITSIVDAAREYSEKQQNWIILPLHSTLSIAEQDKVFDYAPDGMRKCIVSTNIAETSVTIDGIRFVVDSGKVKEMSYDPTTKMQRLKEFWISRASAEQRKGRAGRTGPGVCFRLYAEKQFCDFEAYSTAEILKVPLESLLLQMISMGLPNARLFPFIEPPPMDNVENAIVGLKEAEALTEDEKLTPLGKALAKIPVDISIGKMLLMGCVFQQLQPVLTLAAALSVQSPFTNRAYRDPECERARKSLECDHGDPITLLNAYKEWLELKQNRSEYGRQDDDDRRGESSKTWCRRRGLEEQRFYEITKLRNQFQDLLQDCGLMEVQSNENLSSAERAIRNGELRQLKELRKAHRMEAPRKRKLLKSQDPWSMGAEDDGDADGGRVDIRDVEFRLSHDASKLQNLVSGATACSYRDLMTLKLILVSGLYPQVAIADEFNYCKSLSEQFFHTRSKPYVSLHPMSFFGNNAQVLQLTEAEIEEKPALYKSRQPLSSHHQIVCYLTLLETNKSYLTNTLRMPAAQTLLLFAHTIETNTSFSRIVCDAWLCLDFLTPESGQALLLKATKLRRLWNQLLVEKLKALTITADGELGAPERKISIDQMNRELWSSLAQFMNIEVCYTIKKLLPADLKSLYKGPQLEEDEQKEELPSPNPFAEGFHPLHNEQIGGVYLTEHITYGCIVETDWSLQMYSEILEQDWECSNCKGTYRFTGLQKLQHAETCKPTEVKQEEEAGSYEGSASERQNLKRYDCASCGRRLILRAIDVLKHKKSCQRNATQVKQEPPEGAP
ncbi:probable ATP-dependent RNA helicase DHX34 [Anopheles cruzii]|uniref:probable ATP-dependent RNA helicase DHX34 n=1 Tax=Anopheles cruzii TaxID=68878 RepID=UPI0022EC4D41|nr:probable ATP-dependent RNA helicase DHX34 [Anopheles cruzii]